MTDRDRTDIALDTSVTRPPLAGFRIVSLAEQFPGPYATMLLADLGADVILVERPGGGDPSRRFDGHFEALNRNKRSICLDLKTPEGHAALLRLLDVSDVLIEGFRPGVMDRLGLGASALRGQRSDLVYLSISSFGQDGPRRDVAGHDLSIQASAGMIDASHLEGQLPVLPMADIASGTFAALGIVVSLLARAGSGRGATVDVSMYDALLSWMTPFLVPAMNGMTQAPFPPGEPGYGVFSSADGGLFTLSIAGEDAMWRALCGLLDLQEFAGATEPERVARRAEILPRLKAALASHPLEWILDNLERLKIAFGPVTPPDNVPDDPQVAARGMIVGPAAGTGRRYVRQPLLIDGLAGTIGRAAPRLGQHTDEVLAEIGYSREDLDRLRATGAIDGA